MRRESPRPPAGMRIYSWLCVCIYMYILFILYIYIYMYIKYMMTSDNDLLGPGALLNGGIQLVVPSFPNLLARPVCVYGCVCVCVCV